MKKKLRILIFFFLLSGLSIPLSAQSIKGVIADKGSGETVIGANVIIKGTTTGTVTGVDGSFVLEVPAGENTILISYVGYLEIEKEINASAGEETDMGTIELEADAIALDEMMVIASYAKDRSTPVAFSTIKPEMILEKLGTQEYPEILKSTPSVYATKGGGGYGDGRINLRGFDSNNIGVLINGVPVNDMESGKVYWSNWAGLSDVTRTMQVQRGLGASKLAISSVGGTINILTKSTDMKKGGSVYYGMGNDNYQKKSFTLSTGLLDNGWAVTVSGAQTSGDGYVKATNFNGYSYFFNISKRLTDMQTLSLTAFGASQWHNQRGFQSIDVYRNSPDGRLTNANYGYRNGEIYAGAYSYNKYSKPQTSLNHFWTINNSTTLSTSVYASFGRGGGRRIYGDDRNQLSLAYPSGVPYGETSLTTEGLLDFDPVIDANATSDNGSNAAVAMSTNSHDWYGILSSLNTQIGGVSVTAGVDGRYYKGYHYYEVDDLMGGEYFLDPYASGNPNRDGTERLKEGDIFRKNYVGELLWSGGFLQGEYTVNEFSAFISASASNTMNRRTDFINYTPEEGQQTDWINFFAYSVKGGANYNINEQHNVFLNGGYFIKAPFFNNIFLNSKNDINNEAAPERVFSTEIGYGFKNKFMKVDLTGYRTSWLDKSFAGRTQDGSTFNMRELDALHQGLEAEITLNVVKKLDIRLMGSLGDWTWVSNGTAEYIDEKTGLVTANRTVYAKGIHVGDAAQTTAAIGVDYEVLPKLKVGVDMNYYDNLYAWFDVTQYSSESSLGQDAWKMPTYELLDLSISYRFKAGKFNSTVYGKVNNILDTEYFSDAYDGAEHNVQTAGIYYGFGRTMSIGLRMKF